jgi:hypothetical protein
MAARDRRWRLAPGAALLTLSCGAQPASSPTASSPPGATAPIPAEAPTFEMPAGVGPKTFLVLGPFPNEGPDDGGGRPGLDHDYLGSLGGEAHARIDAGAKVLFEGAALEARPASLDRASVLDYKKLFAGVTDSRTAYAYAEWNVSVPGPHLVVFGSDDAAEVWLDGALVHRAAADRGMVADSDRFVVHLEPGAHRMLVKVDNGEGAWAFALRVLDAPSQASFASFEARRHLESVGAAPAGGSFLLDETFPDLTWRDPSATAVFEEAAPSVRWYGPDLAPSARPASPGQYTAVVGARTRDGYAFRQMLAFAKVAPDVLPKLLSPPTHELPVLGVDWPAGTRLGEAERTELSRYFWTAPATT